MVMAAALPNISNKYQGVASKQVVSAVQRAAARTGTDFSYLMEKASTESSFDTQAKSKSSSATGLFQFIESTWLNMVKQFGPAFGLGNLAQHIDIKDGKPCVDNCAVRNQILNLRKNPEISALMAGAYSAQNKSYLENHTEGDVGGTELYLAHFLGANGATKFLNARAQEGNASAAQLFPQAAHVNKNVFYDKATGQPRTLDQIYDLFAGKFDDSTKDGATPSPSSASSVPLTAEIRPVLSAPAPSLGPLQSLGQALSLFSDGNEDGGIVWNSGRQSALPPSKISPMHILSMASAVDHMPASGYGAYQDRFGFNA
jgi:hypothetical protein